MINEIFKQGAAITLKIQMLGEQPAVSYLSTRLENELPDTANKQNLISIITEERQATLQTLLDECDPIQMLLKSSEIQKNQTSYTKVWHDILKNKTSKLNLLLQYARYARNALAEMMQAVTEDDVQTAVTQMLSRNYQTVKRLEEAELELTLEETITKYGRSFCVQWLCDIFCEEIGSLLNAHSLRNAHAFPMIAHNIAKKLDSSRSDISYHRIDAPAHMEELFSGSLVMLKIGQSPTLTRKNIVKNLADAIEAHNSRKALSV